MGGSSGLTFREIERKILLTLTFILLAHLCAKQSRIWTGGSSSSLTTSTKPHDLPPPATITGNRIIEIPKGKFASGAPLAQMAPASYHYDEINVSQKTTLHGVAVRPFAPHPAKDITCSNGSTSSGGGLTYIQVQINTGWMSTTPPSVHYRIAKKLGCDGNNVAILHKNNGRTNKDKKSLFRWTTIQDPTHRLLYTFFFKTVSNYKKEPNDRNFHEFEKQHFFGSSQLLDRLSPAKPTATAVPQIGDSVRIAQRVSAIMDSFDFVALQERMEESLVALSMLLQIPIRDIMHLAPAMVGWPGQTKKKLGHFQGNIKDPSKKCTYVIPAFVSPGLKEYFNATAYQNSVKAERILYQVANRTLDLTIATFNQKEFESNLQVFRQAQAVALYTCQDEPSILDAVQFPCMRNGKFNPAQQADCVRDDYGCGFACLDQVANDMNL
jgi:hypothetical protein